MIESKNNKDKESSNNIKNLDFAVTIVITAIVNVVVNIVMQNLSVKFQDLEVSQDSLNNKNQDF